jgi:hypothetical protein
MIQQCAWCKKEIARVGKGTQISDGICADCRAAYFPETLRTVQENAQALLAQFKRAL